jgi:hypothetical protein
VKRRAGRGLERVEGEGEENIYDNLEYCMD